MTEAAPPGGPALALAKRAAEQVLWMRVRMQRTLSRGQRPLPSPVPPTDVLSRRAEWESAVAECRRLGLPLHHDRAKNWDALGAVSTVLASTGPDAAILDAGTARYSSILPWLRLYGRSNLVGNNIEFGRETRRDGVLFRYGDITATDFPDGSFDVVTCMSVIEHGVPLKPFLMETERILKPNGMLVVSTDYDQEPPDTTGMTAYGVPVRIFGPDGIRELVQTAEECGLALRGELRLEHAERPVHWPRTGLDYTFIRLTFHKAP